METTLVLNQSISDFININAPKYQFIDEKGVHIFRSKQEYFNYFAENNYYIDSQTANDDDTWNSINLSTSSRWMQNLAEIFYNKLITCSN